MFCYQCQETANGAGCTVKGVCGKESNLSNKMDMLIFIAKGVACIADRLRKGGKKIGNDVDCFITDALFSTITNTNFCTESITKKIKRGLKIREKLKHEAAHANILLPDIPQVEWHGGGKDDDNMETPEIGVLKEKDVDVRSLKELVLYGLKGICAYVSHAMHLGYNNQKIHIFIQNALSRISTDDLSVKELTGLVMETGEFGIKAMELLDKANTESYGEPMITTVATGVRNRPGILVTGHDLYDLHQLLEQTQGTGVDVYTHCEMLPAHYYPAFRKFRHFAGNYGGSWWKQRDEFEKFNGPILFTSNCLVPPFDTNTYKKRMYTTNACNFPGCTHISADKFGKKDYSQLIEVAKKCDPPQMLENSSITGGFAHYQVIGLLDIIVDAIKSGLIRKIVVMAGCDGRSARREYYTEFARKLPDDCVILTAGCAKFRYIKMDLGTINGIPRVLDAGQCNDCYSIAMIALTLKQALGLKNINDLPIVYNIAWYEQKAVIVLLSLIALGIKNIHLGPTYPAFISENVLDTLSRHFKISGITTPDNDLKEFGLTK